MNGLMNLWVATHQKKVRIWQQRPRKVSFIEQLEEHLSNRLTGNASVTQIGIKKSILKRPIF